MPGDGRRGREGSGRQGSQPALLPRHGFLPAALGLVALVAGCTGVEHLRPTDWLRIDARRARAEMPHVHEPRQPPPVVNRKVGDRWHPEDVEGARAAIVVSPDAVVFLGEPVLLLRASGARRELSSLGCTPSTTSVTAAGAVVCLERFAVDETDAGATCHARLSVPGSGDEDAPEVVDFAWSPAIIPCAMVEVRWLGTASGAHVLWFREGRSRTALGIVDAKGHLRFAAEVDYQVGDPLRWAAKVVSGFLPGREPFRF